MERRVLSPNVQDDASTPSIVQTAGSPLTNRAAMLYNRGPQYQGGLRSLVAPPRTPVGGEADRQKMMDAQRQSYRNFLTQNLPDFFLQCIEYYFFSIYQWCGGANLGLVCPLNTNLGHLQVL